jgi:glycosyltransferase involved in cell wall biosynthesis
MKIAFLKFGFPNPFGGAEVFTYNIMNQLAKRSHQIDIYLAHDACREVKRLTLQKHFRCLPIYSSDLVIRFPRLIAMELLIRHYVNRYDLCQLIGAYPLGVAAEFLASRGIPVVLRCHGEDIQQDRDLNYGLRLNAALAPIINRTVHNMTHLVALTESVRSEYLHMGVPGDMIKVIPNGVDLKRFKSSNSDRQKVRNEFGIKHDEYLILTTGRYHVKKGFETIPATAKILMEKGYRFRWLIIGNGTEQLESKVKKYQVQDVIILKPAIGIEPKVLDSSRLPSNKMIELYKSADIFVMPSLLETFGMVLIEAMAAGLPVVTTEAPGCRDVVKHEFNGLIAERRNPVSLAANIERMLIDGQLRLKLLNNTQAILPQYDWPKVADQYEELYRQIIDK